MAKNPYLVRAIEERTAQTAVLNKLQDTAAEGKRDLDDSERRTFDELVARVEFLDGEIKRISEADSAAARFAELIGAQREAEEQAGRAHDATRVTVNEPEQPEQRGAFNYGRAFVESTAFKEYRGHGTSAAVDLPGLASPEFRAAIKSTDYSALQTPTTYTPPEPTERNRFLDLIGREVVGNGAFTYLQWGEISEAAEVNEGSLKPEADLAMTEGAGTLATYAHYKGITRQALEDIPRIQSIVQSKLLLGVRNKLNSVAAAAFVASGDVPTVEGASLVAAIRAGIAEVEDAGYEPNTILLNPQDAGDLDLEVMAGTVSGPVRVGSAFGLSIATSKATPRGTAGVGDFRSGLTWFDRNVLSSYITDSHADYFLRNQLVLLAETRARILVTEPVAMAKATFTATAPADQTS